MLNLHDFVFVMQMCLFFELCFHHKKACIITFGYGNRWIYEGVCKRSGNAINRKQELDLCVEYINASFYRGAFNLLTKKLKSCQIQKNISRKTIN